MNILFFGPNGSGKGTQGAIVKDKYNAAHIESGAIFRDNIKGGTELGKQAKEYIDKGELVPDEITIPMILDRLKQDDCKGGWLLDGFPRNKNQAIKLDEALKAENMSLDIVVEILLDRQIAKDRIMGRRLCAMTTTIPTISLLMQLNLMETNAGYAAVIYLKEPTIRMREQSTIATAFTMTPTPAHLQQHIISKT